MVTVQSTTEKQQLENGEIERVEESWHAFSKELVRTFALFSVDNRVLLYSKIEKNWERIA